ncbi:MAG: dihydroorotate dehydrogenase electron transfer subunit [Nitriliruptoraceae bacterium]
MAPGTVVGGLGVMARFPIGQVRGRLDDATTPVGASCEVVVRRREGAYWLLTMAAPEIARRAQPGQFVSIAVESRGALLRRPFSIAKVTRRGAVAGTIDVIFDDHGPGTNWLTRVQLHDTLDVIGPLGRGFPLPQRKVACLLVGGGYGVAPLFFLARALSDSGLRVDMLVGAATADRIHDAIETKSLSVSATFTTEDGSYGHQGRVTDVLDEAIERAGAGVVYACGPNAMLRAVSERCAQRGIPVQISLEERMACGTGVCFTCVVPMRGRDGEVVHRRSCIDGPVVNGAHVAWERTRFGVPSGTVAVADESHGGHPADPQDDFLDADETKLDAGQDATDNSAAVDGPAALPPMIPESPRATRRGVLGKFGPSATPKPDSTLDSDRRDHPDAGDPRRDR